MSGLIFHLCFVLSMMTTIDFSLSHLFSNVFPMMQLHLHVMSHFYCLVGFLWEQFWK